MLRSCVGAVQKSACTGSKMFVMDVLRIKEQDKEGRSLSAVGNGGLYIHLIVDSADT